MKIKLIILIGLLPLIGFSQQIIKGHVSSKNEDKIPFANIVLKEDNILLKGVITDDDGNFEITAPIGKYVLSISFVGYKNWDKVIDLNGDLDLGNIELEEESVVMDEVVLKVEKPIIIRKPDRLVFNVEKSVSASGGDALDVLRIAPGLRIQDNSISMLGKSGMRVMIDGRLLNLSEEELVNYLNTIKSDDIKNIEIITNPPAKYEAQGNAGLINIILKRANKNSWNNSITGTYKQIAVPYFSIGNNFKYRKNRISLLSIINVNLGDQRYFQEAEVFYPDNNWFTETQQDRSIRDFSGRLNFDYEISEKSTIGFLLNGGVVRHEWDDNADSFITETSSGNVSSIIRSKGVLDREVDNYSANFHYTTKLDTLGKSISVDLDYFNYYTNDKRNILANNLSANQDFISVNYDAINNTNRTIDNYSARLDVTHPIKWFNLSYGGKLSYINTDYGIDIREQVPNNSTIDQFKYEEEIQAIYVNGNKKLSEKTTLQLGLRVENTNVEGKSEILDSNVKNSYFNLFPSLYLNYKHKEQSVYTLSYGKRINRPFFYFLNPAVYNINNNLASRGNPFLTPSFTNSFSLSNLYKGKLNTTLFFDIETDGYGVIPLSDSEGENQLYTFFNYYDLYTYGLSQSYSFKINSWWSNQSQYNLLGYNSKIIDASLDIPVESDFTYYITTNNTIKVNLNNSIELGYWYSGPVQRNSTMTEKSHALNIGYKYQSSNKKWQFSLNLSDIFDTSYPLSTFNVNGIKSTHRGWGVYRGRIFRCSLNYNFGNNKINVKNRKSGNESEKTRAN